jgi:hypothetical protein
MRQYFKIGIVAAVLSILIISLSFREKKFNRTGILAEYPPIVLMGQEVHFAFVAGDNVHKIRVFSDGKSLGSTQVQKNKANLKFVFNFPSQKKMKFVGLDKSGQILSELLGNIVVKNPSEQKAFKKIIYYKIGDSEEEIPTTKFVTKKEDIVPNLLKKNGLAFSPVPAEDAINGKNDNVYNTATGHPTAAESKKFMDEISGDAMELSDQYNVPASVIMAMCALESGYGYSRTAVFANNFFGIKQWNGNSSNAFQLIGQPDENDGFAKVIRKTESGQLIYDETKRPDNWYKLFRSRRESMEFLVEEVFLHKTGQWKKDYSDIVKTYQRNIAAGIEKKEAAYTFIYALGDKGYCHKGGKYYFDRMVKVMDRWGLYDYD